MRWFENHRIEWIAEMVHIYGFINREQIIRKFEVTEASASRDLQQALARYPDLMTYNAHTKRYERVEPPQGDNYRHPYSWQTSHTDEEGVHQFRMKPNGETERRIIKTKVSENEVRADGGCLYCDADQGENHRPDCTRPSMRDQPRIAKG